jgi:acetolactate synthase I/II/III large subunit
MRQAEMAAAVTKASRTVRSAELLGEELVRAWREAVSGTPGPVHLSVPSDILDAAVSARVPAPGDFAVLEQPVQDPAALDALAAATRPLIVIGPMLMAPRMRQRVRELEDLTGIPVIGLESPRGTGDPSLGRLAQILKKADVVLLLGKRLDFTLKFGEAFVAGCKVLQAPPNLAGWTGRRWPKSGWRDEVRAELAYRPPEWKAIESAPGAPLHPVHLCREVQKLLAAPDAVLVSDGGEFGQWAQACLEAPARIINGPAGAIGSALPFAAAAKLARPDATVVAMLGDGTFGFHMAEIDTALRCELDYIAVIGNDATWNAEYQIQLRAYGKARAKGCELLPTRYGAVAAAMGAHGEDVVSASELNPALARAATAGKPAVVNVMIERQPAPKY